jgi:regulator of cell morphogenesis and NO signaling
MNYDIDKMTVAEVVTKNIKTADIFKSNGIDFCCGGNVSVKEICKKKAVDYDKLKAQIDSLENKVDKHLNFDSWDLDFLADYIVNTHHNYVTEANNLITQYSNKVAKVHGSHNPEVIEINELFMTVADELNLHMHKEEMILFPFIRKLANAKKLKKNIDPPHFGSIKNPINMMELEHIDAGDIMKKISKLSNNFTPPDHACNTYRALYAKLEEYQADLFQHIHLENNILFPKAIKLEHELLN